MINLLPQDMKQEIRAARLNVILVRYLGFAGASIVFMGMIFGVGYYITISDQKRAENELAEIRKASAKYDKTKQKAESFEKNLSIAKDILSGEIIFSDLLVNIAKTLPAGTIMTDFNIATESIGKPMVINARTTDAEGGLRLKEHLEKSPYFDNVSIQTITNPVGNSGGSQSGTTIAAAPDYPYMVVLSATLVAASAPQDSASAPAGGAAR